MFSVNLDVGEKNSIYWMEIFKRLNILLTWIIHESRLP